MAVDTSQQKTVVMLPAQTPAPPYYAVIFTSTRTAIDADYAHTADRMVELAAEQPGFLGVDSARNHDGANSLGITVSYWDSLDAIRNWRQQAEHTLAREQGRATWYETYQLRICRIERDYGWEKPADLKG